MPVVQHIALNDYEDALLARLYDAEYDGADSDLGFYLERLVPGPVLELASGTGRLAVRLAERGRRVVGLDASRAMLARAHTRPGGAGVRWCAGDMTDFALGEHFANILVPFSGLAFLTTAESRGRCLACCRRHLAPGGLLVVDLFNGTQPTASGTTTAGRSVIDPQTGEVFLKSAAVDHAPGLVVIRYRWRSPVLALEQTLRLAVLDRTAVEAELEAAGFLPLEVLGDYRGGPYTGRSPRLLLLAAAAD